MANSRRRIRRKSLYSNTLRCIPIANDVTQRKKLFGMKFAVETLRKCKETFRLQTQEGTV
jgi:hypothetical protein